MFRQLGRFLALILIAAGSFAVARPAPAQTIAVATVKSVDVLQSDVRYVLKLAGQEELAKQLGALMEAVTGDKGIAGIDTKRSIGLYVNLPKRAAEQPAAVVFVPITDEESFLDLIKKFGIEPAKGDDGIYSFVPPGGKKSYVRFANKHAYGSDTQAALQGKLADPATLISEVHKTADIALSIRLDQVPAELKKGVIKGMDQKLQEDKAKKPGESEAQHKVRLGVAKLAREAIVCLVEDSKELSLSLHIDQKADKLTLDYALSAQSGTKLAKAISGFGTGRSRFSGLAKGAAASLLVHVPISEEVRREFSQLVVEALHEVVRKEADPVKEAWGEKMLKAIEPTLKTDVIDFGVALRGPGADHQYAVVAGLRVKEGKRLEELVRELVKALPAGATAHIKLDHDKAGGTAIHLIEPAKAAKEEAKRILGSETVCFAIKDDVILAAVGEHGLSALKEALTKSDSVATEAPVQLELSLSRLVGLAKENRDEAAAVAAKVFAGADKSKDKVRLTLQGGEGLHVRLEVDAAVIRLVSALARHKAEEK
jgi:hypothetical protein